MSVWVYADDQTSRSTVACNEERGLVLIDNACDGLDLFTLPDHKWAEHLPTGARTIHFPLGVAFAESGTVAVGGSDCGLVHVFDLERMESWHLRHGARGLVQKVVVRLSSQ